MALPAFALHFLFMGLSFFLCIRMLVAFSWWDLPGLCGVYALSHVVGLLALAVPAGLGIREGSLALQLGRALPTGVAAALALGARLWFTLSELIFLIAVLLLAPRLPRPDAAEKLGLRKESESS